LYKQHADLERFHVISDTDQETRTLPTTAQRATAMVSLHALIHLGILSETRRDIFQAHLRLPMSDKLAPWDIYVGRNGSTIHLDLVGFFPCEDERAAHSRQQLSYLQSNKEKKNKKNQFFSSHRAHEWQPSYNPTPQLLESENVAIATEIAQMIAENVRTRNFSLIEYGSEQEDGWISTLLANGFPHASIISIAAQGYTDNHQARLILSNIDNNIVCAPSESAKDLAKAFYSSPEFFQYQLFNQLFEQTVFSREGRQLLRSDKNALGRFVGRSLSNGITSFVRLPSAQRISLAMHSLYDEPSLDAQHYAVTSHPAPRFAQFEQDFFTNLVGINGLKAIQVHKMDAPQSLEGESALGRESVMRVDLVNMTRLVNHHFFFRT